LILSGNVGRHRAQSAAGRHIVDVVPSLMTMNDLEELVSAIELGDSSLVESLISCGLVDANQQEEYLPPALCRMRLK
jgi:hypothetical protein